MITLSVSHDLKVAYLKINFIAMIVKRNTYISQMRTLTLGHKLTIGDLSFLKLGLILLTLFRLFPS